MYRVKPYVKLNHVFVLKKEDKLDESDKKEKKKVGGKKKTEPDTEDDILTRMTYDILKEENPKQKLPGMRLIKSLKKKNML